MITLNPEISLGTLINNSFGDQYLFSVNQKLIEKIDYQTLFNKEFGQSFKAKDTLYVVTGTDSGLMVKQLLKNPPERGSAYIFIEFPEIIELTKDQYDLSEHKRIIVTTEDKWQEEAVNIGLETYFFINKVITIKSLATQYYHLGEYLFLRQAIEDTINHLTWQYQSQLGGSNFVQKQLENIAENHTPAIALKDYFKGKSALILAGGPSLDKYIPWIENNQQNYVVIAVTRIARRLLETKIKPDIFISVDPFPSNFYVSKEVFNFEKESLLVHQYHLSPMLLGNWLGVNLYLGKLFPWQTKLEKTNLDGIGPTVTNTAILYAIQMGIKQQILFGVDLCYSQEGYTHANGSSEHDDGPIINEIGQTVITNSGQKAETNSAYYEAITTIEQLAEVAKETGGQLINPSPDSAQMKHVEHLLIDDIGLDKEPVSIDNFLQQQFKQQQSEQQENSDYKVNHYKMVLKELIKAQLKVSKIEKLANTGLEYNEKFFTGGDPSANFKFKIKMDKLEKQLNHKDLTAFTELSKKFGMNEFLYFLNPDKEREWTDEEIKQSGDTYYKALRTGANKLGRHIFTAINRTEMRLLENNALTLDDKLIKRHLCCFDKSYLLDRSIVDQQQYIKRNLNQWTIENKKNQQEQLEKLLQNKKNTINDNNTLFSQFKNKSNLLGKNTQERTHTLLFYTLMLQNEESYQPRRLSICIKQNLKLLSLPEYCKIINKEPTDYLIKLENINELLNLKKQNINLLKIQNQILNLAENHTSTLFLKQYFKTKSAIILSDEKSLGKYTKWIEANQNKYIIIALSSLAKNIISTTIEPDFIIASTPDKLNFKCNRDIIYFEQKSILIHKSYFLPQLLGNWLGINFYTGDLLPWKSELNCENYNCDIDNELINAICFASYIGLEHKILFFNVNKNYFDLKKYIFSNKKECENLFTPCNLPTSTLSISHIQINKIKTPEDTINKSILYKQLIKNNKYKYFKQITNQLNKVYIDIQKNASYLAPLLKQFIPDKVQTSKKTDDKKYYFLKFISIAIMKTEIRLIEDSQLTINKEIVFRHLSNKDNLLLGSYPLASPIFKTRDIVKIDFIKNTQHRMLATCFFLVIHFNGLNLHNRRIIKLLENQPEFMTISEQTVVRDKKVKDMIKDQIQAYQNFFPQKSEVLDEMRLSGIEIKLYNLFILKNKNSIKKIIKGLKVIKNKNNPYLHLANGYYYELKNNIEQAIIEYGLANHKRTRESSLKRIALITLENGNIEYAHNTLQLLSKISPSYLPQLAELYFLTKNYKDALNAYLQYLDYNSSDIAVLLKVAKIYKSQKVFDGANFIYKKILELAPENKTAKNNLKNKKTF